ncbi:MAG: polysaccharide biosynthesis/export family protein [Planctomycetales bacterium]|nr:polysaccharide biosynthesis/export family protein [Planctomycetales bacterium]
MKNSPRLQIQPGTKSTRLQGGNYEIVIDAPSDRFSVSNQQFTIRNGQTVVATITQRHASPEPTANEITSSLRSTDRRLDEVVYNGDTLDTWLRRLQFERSPDTINEAVQAIDAMASDQVADLIEPVLLEFLKSHPTFGQSASRALRTLARVSGEHGFDNLSDILRARTPQESQINIVIHASMFTARRLENMHAFLNWCSDALRNEQDLRLHVGVALRHVCDAQYQTCQECEAAVLDVLIACKQLSNEEYWLNPSYTSDIRSPLLRQEIFRRAIDVLGDEDVGVELATKAALFLGMYAQYRDKLNLEQRSRLVESLASRFLLAAQNPRQSLDLLELPNSSGGVAPILPNVVWGRHRSKTANPLIVLLNLVSRLELQQNLVNALTELHRSFASLDLYADEYSNAFRRVEVGWDVIVNSPAKYDEKHQALLQQVIYVQSGLLIGKEYEPLVARFSEKLPVDYAAESQRLLEQVKFGDDSARRKALDHAYQLVPAAYGEPWIPELVRLLAEQPAWLDLDSATILSSRFAGDQFLGHYAQALQSASTDKSVKLLSADRWIDHEFGCSDVDSVTQWMVWCDSIFASSHEKYQPIQAALTKILRQLLRDRSELQAVYIEEGGRVQRKADLVSIECQETILRHLQSYSQLTDENFWFSQPVSCSLDDQGKRNDQEKMDAPFRRIVFERAVEALSSKNPNQTVAQVEQLHAHSLMMIGDVLSIDGLSQEHQRAIVAYLRSALTDASKQLDSKSEFHELYGKKLGTLSAPKLPGLSVSNTFGTCNVLLCSLNVVAEMDLSDELRTELKMLQEAAAVFPVSRDYSAVWVGRVSDQWLRFKSGSDIEPPQMFLQTVYVQAGLLLGQEFNDLRSTLTRRKQEYDEARRSLVESGDTLAVYVPHFLPPGLTPTPVIQAGKRTPVSGYPVPVNSEGEISLPLTGTLSVAGKDLETVRELIVQRFARNAARTEDELVGTTVQFLLRAGEQLELRNITGQPTTAE